MWISVNPRIEREEVVQSSMALSGWYEQGWSDERGLYLEYPPEPSEPDSEEIAALYNNADKLGLDIYTVGEVKEEDG